MGGSRFVIDNQASNRNALKVDPSPWCPQAPEHPTLKVELTEMGQYCARPQDRAFARRHVQSSTAVAILYVWLFSATTRESMHSSRYENLTCCVEPVFGTVTCLAA